MASDGHTPATLPPPSTQPFRHGDSPNPYSDSPGTLGNSYTSSSRHYIHHTAEGGHAGPFPPPPPYGSPSPPGAYARPAGAAVQGDVTHVAIPSTVYVTPPKIEMQPWARKAWRWLVVNTTGVARVDLRRPTPPLPEQYGGNLLVVRSRESVTTHRDTGGTYPRQMHGGRGPEALPAYPGPTYNPVYGQPYPGVSPVSPNTNPLLMGARIKITRSFIIGGSGGWKRVGAGDDLSSTDTAANESPEAVVAPAAEDGSSAPHPHHHHQHSHHPPKSRSWSSDGFRGQRGGLRRGSPLARSWAEKPLLDIGVGVNLDVDQQQIQPVARIKIKDLVSVKAAPLGLLKISRSIPLGPVALKVRYELPLAHARHFWEPPARLMVRLDNAAGSGVHLTPGGLELDEQVLQFGSAVNLRASASLLFPRQLPLVEGEPPFRLQLQRLSLRSLW